MNHRIGHAVVAALFALSSLLLPMSTAAASGAPSDAGMQQLMQHLVDDDTSSTRTLTSADAKADGVIDSNDLRVMMVTTTTYAAGATATTKKTTKKTTTTTKPTGIFGVDVSYAQSTIDWVEAKKSGVSFAIIRCGYGQDETDQDDEFWEYNVAECERLGIPYGAYFFCYARTEKEAAGEAKHALRLLKGKKLSMPIFYDMEYSSYQGDLSNEEYAAIAKKFCSTVAKAGYTVGVYANLDWWNNRLTDSCFDNWFRWVAQYNDECEYDKAYQLWQYSEDEEVDGITENTVDVNYCYVNFVGTPIERRD